MVPRSWGMAFVGGLFLFLVGIEIGRNLSFEVAAPPSSFFSKDRASLLAERNGGASERVIKNSIEFINASLSGQQDVIVLSPVQNAAGHLSRFFALLAALSYPRDRLSIGVLEEGSNDDTWQKLRQEITKLDFGRKVLIKADLSFLSNPVKNGLRHAQSIQLARRSNLAKVRNILQQLALKDEKWVLWIDSDLFWFPVDIIQKLQSSGQQMVAANVVFNTVGSQSYDLNSFQNTERTKEYIKMLSEDKLLLEGYKENHFRKSLSELRSEGDLVKLDGVGGGMLLVDADLVRQGLVFPTFVFHHEIETEGYAEMAKRMGVQPYGMPFVECVHK